MRWRHGEPTLLRNIVYSGTIIRRAKGDSCKIPPGGGGILRRLTKIVLPGRDETAVSPPASAPGNDSESEGKVVRKHRCIEGERLRIRSGDYVVQEAWLQWLM